MFIFVQIMFFGILLSFKIIHSECKKSCKNPQKLNNHRKCRTDERPYSCSDCEKHSRIRNSLEKHKREIHTEISTFKCESCGKSFKRNSHLKYHKLIHKSEKHFSCMQCGKTFSQKEQIYWDTSLQINRNTYMSANNKDTQPFLVINAMCSKIFPKLFEKSYQHHS